MINNYRTSPEGREFIHAFETCVLKAYPDPATKNDPVKKGKPWTIGWGTTGSVRRDCGTVCAIYQGMECTQSEADRWFEERLAQFERAVNSLVHVEITQGQFDALVSFAYNVGSDIDDDTIAEGLGDSTLLRKLNAGDYMGCAAEWPKWDMANGRHMEGLKRRRLGEMNMFINASKVRIL